MHFNQISRCALCLVLLSTLSNLSVAQIIVELRSAVTINKEQVVLGDVANLSAKDPETLQRLARIYLGRAPKLGKSVSLKRNNIARWLQGRYPDLYNEVRWTGADFVQLGIHTQSLSADSLVRAGEEVLRRWLDGRFQSVDVKSVQDPPVLVLPLGEVEIRPHVLNDKTRMQKRMTVWIEVWLNHRFNRLIPITFEVMAMKEMAVAAVQINVGEEIRSDQVKRKLIDVAGEGDDFLEIKSIGERVRAKLPISVGRILSRDNCEEMPLALRGERLTLVARHASLELESAVEALQDGAMGQRIRVRQKSGAPGLTAKVVGRGLVEIEL